MELADQSIEEFMGVASQGRMTRQAPVRAEPHPTYPRCLADDVIPYGIGRPIYRGNSWGVASQGRMTRQAPVRVEPHPAYPPRL
jgi:hypothetical protein